MVKQQKLKITAGLLFMLAAFIVLFIANIPTLNGKTLSFASTYKEKSVTLKATYWEAEDAEYAVLICPGYSCDRQKWRPFADLFVKNGCTTMVFDYAGQGASSSAIGFDNAKTDAIPAEIDDAIEFLHETSGIDYDHIVLVGHSMGGRAILRLLYDYNNENAETAVTKKDIPAVILMSPEVNYCFNAQASLFAGTADDVDEPWASFSETDIAGTDVYLYGSAADDIVSDENILAIYSRLGGRNLPESGLYEDTQINGSGSTITVGITAGILHSYQMYSPEFAAYVNGAITNITGKAASFAPSRMLLIYFGWAFALLGVGLLLAGLNEERETEKEALPTLINTRRFLVCKLLMWLPGLGAAFIICCICVILPFGSPVMNIPYMCCIAGYGLVMLLAYRKGRFKGTEGKLPPILKRKGESCSAGTKAGGSAKSLLATTLIATGICLFVWYVLRASMYRLIPLNFRLFWVLFAGVLMTIGYYISGCERDMLSIAGASRRVRLLYDLIQYVALFLLVLFYLVIGSYSGLIGQVQNMILLYVFCIPLGDFIRKRTGSRLAGAFVSGLVFQTLMITSSALIAIF